MPCDAYQRSDSQLLKALQLLGRKPNAAGPGHCRCRMDVDVSENSGTPKSSIFIGVFRYKPSILGYPYFLETPMYGCMNIPFCCIALNTLIMLMEDVNSKCSRLTKQNHIFVQLWNRFTLNDMSDTSQN